MEVEKSAEFLDMSKIQQEINLIWNNNNVQSDDEIIMNNIIVVQDNQEFWETYFQEEKYLMLVEE